MSESQPFILSLQALSELREIVHDELDNAMPEPSIEEMGIRLLRVFSIITKVPVEDMAPKQALTKNESKALTFFGKEISEHQSSPSMRAISSMLSLRSSRSGYMVVQKLLEKGLMIRCSHGRLSLNDMGQKMLQEPLKVPHLNKSDVL